MTRKIIVLGHSQPLVPREMDKGTGELTKLKYKRNPNKKKKSRNMTRMVTVMVIILGHSQNFVPREMDKNYAHTQERTKQATDKGI